MVLFQKAWYVGMAVGWEYRRFGVALRRLGVALRRLMNPTSYLILFGLLQIDYLAGLGRIIGPQIALVACGAVAALLVVRVVPIGWRWRFVALVFVIGLATVVPTVALITVRAHIGNTFEHDGLVQTEAAVARLVRGQPIYGVDWSNTDVARYAWVLPGTNPALHHYGYFPLVPLAGVPWWLLTRALAIAFDYRVVLLGFLAVGVAGVAALPIAWSARFMVALAIFLDPFTVAFFWAGRNDLCYIALLLVGLALLARGHPVAACLAFGTAAALKPFAALALPLILITLWLRWQGRPLEHRREALLSLAALMAPVVLTVSPFLLENGGALWRDVVVYYNGGTPDTYPINGYGLAELLLQFRVVKSAYDPFPFGIFQLVASLPMLWLGWRTVRRQPTLGTWLAAYVCLFFVFAFCSRLFNDNYLFAFLALAACIVPLGNAPLLRRSNAERTGRPSDLAHPAAA